jgi:uncharacterized protein (TIGR00645 family)
MAPVYLGLVIAMGLLLVKFAKELISMVGGILEASSGDIIVGVLTLVDVALIMNLIIIIVFSGYENFVSRMDLHDHEDRPEWMGHIGFSDLKIKVIASIMAISGIELLKAFMNVGEFSDKHLAWMIGLHLTFVLSGVMYAFMDKLSHSSGKAKKVESKEAP